MLKVEATILVFKFINNAMKNTYPFTDEAPDKDDNGQLSEEIQSVQKTNDVAKTIDANIYVSQESVEVVIL